MLLGHLCLYTSQRVAPQQLPGVFQVPRTEELHEPRETARLLATVRRTKLATYGPLLRALVRLRPDFTAFGAEVDVDGFYGERLRVRVPGRSYAVWKVRGGLRWRSFWDVTRRVFHVSTPEPRRFSPVRDGFGEVIKPVPTSKVVDVVPGDVVFREGIHVGHRAFLYSPQHS